MKADLRLIRTLSLTLGVMVIMAACTPMIDTLPGSQTPTTNVFLPGIEQPGIATSPLEPTAAVADTTAAVADTTAAVAETAPAEPTATVAPTEAPRPAIVGPVWQWVSSTFKDGTLLESADPARYTFQLLDDGNALVQADCNFGTATYQDTGTEFSFGPIGTTKMACPPDSLDSEFLGQLRNTGRYEIGDDGLTIYLLDEAGVMQLAASAEAAPAESAALTPEPVVLAPTAEPAPATPAEPAPTAPAEPAPTAPAEPAPQPVTATGLEGSSWVLRNLWVSGQEMLPVQDTAVTLEVSEDGSRISGSTGCNQYRAIWTAGDTGAAVTAPALMTRKTCPANVMVQEVEFIDALLRAKTYGVSDDVLKLYASDDEILMVLLRK